MPIFAVQKTVRMRYSDTIQLTCTSGAMASYVLRANDCFDPDFTGTGHQPMGFDQMILFYNHFVVTKSRLRVTFRNKSNTSPFTALIRVDANSGVLTVPNRVIEFGGLTMAEIDTFAMNSTTLELSVDVAKFLGMNRKTIIADSTSRGDAGSSPAEGVFFHFQVFDTAALTSTANCDFVMEQEVVFIEPRDLTESFRRLKFVNDAEMPMGSAEGKDDPVVIRRCSVPPVKVACRAGVKSVVS